MKLKINSNPFMSKEFVTVWLKHFGHNKPVVSFESIPSLLFIKKKLFPIYDNVGKNQTNGITYDINPHAINSFNGVLLIRDVPSYAELNFITSPKDLKILKVRQYKGYLADFSKHPSVDSYLQTNFKSKSRWQIKKHIKKLQMCYTIKIDVWFGIKVQKEQFEKVFQIFRQLLLKRFDAKQQQLHYLNEDQWNYIKDVFYSLIPQKKAAIFIFYANDEIIAINSNFISDEVVFSFLPTFDIDFSKFNVGEMVTYNIFDWCIKNGFRAYDFSKGEYEYKNRWSDTFYNFNYHLIYNENSLKSYLIAYTLYHVYGFWQNLRDKKFNILYRKLLFFVQNFPKTQTRENVYTMTSLDSFPKEFLLDEIVILDDSNKSVLLKPLNEIAYKKNCSINEFKIYKHRIDQYKFLVTVKEAKLLINFQPKKSI